MIRKVSPSLREAHGRPSSVTPAACQCESLAQILPDPSKTGTWAPARHLHLRRVHPHGWPVLTGKAAHGGSLQQSPRPSICRKLNRGDRKERSQSNVLHHPMDRGASANLVPRQAHIQENSQDHLDEDGRNSLKANCHDVCVVGDE